MDNVLWAFDRSETSEVITQHVGHRNALRPSLEFDEIDFQQRAENSWTEEHRDLWQVIQSDKNLSMEKETEAISHPPLSSMST